MSFQYNKKDGKCILLVKSLSPFRAKPVEVRQPEHNAQHTVISWSQLHLGCVQ